MESLIYNRQPTDFYGASDLNRVEEWIQHIYAQVRALGYSPIVKGRKTWASDSIPRQSAIDAIRSSIINMRDAIYPSVPDAWISITVGSAKTSRDEWDAWEWDLHLLSDTIDAIIANTIFRYANSMFMYSGGEIQ